MGFAQLSVLLTVLKSFRAMIIYSTLLTVLCGMSFSFFLHVNCKSAYELILAIYRTSYRQTNAKRVTIGFCHFHTSTVQTQLS